MKNEAAGKVFAFMKKEAVYRYLPCLSRKMDGWVWYIP